MLGKILLLFFQIFKWLEWLKNIHVDRWKSGQLLSKFAFRNEITR